MRLFRKKAQPLKGSDLEIHCPVGTVTAAAPQEMFSAFSPAVEETGLPDRAQEEETVSRQPRAWLHDEAVRALAVRMRKLPSMPTVYDRITRELQAEEPSLAAIAETISQDPVITAKLLQLVNSGFFGLAAQVVSPHDAVFFLGLRQTRAIVLLAGVFSEFENTRCPGFSCGDFLAHSLRVASAASAIARAETKDKMIADLAFTAGLLHDIGILMLAGNLPESYDRILAQAAERRCASEVMELETYGTTHAELGASVLATWGLPEEILNAVGRHHRPCSSDEDGFTPLTAVHVANMLDPKNLGVPHRPTIDSGYLRRIGMLGRFDDWRALCHNDI